VEPFEKMAQGAATLGADASESWTLIERIVSMPGGQALEQPTGIAPPETAGVAQLCQSDAQAGQSW